MKHVIVIETSDGAKGVIPGLVAGVLIRALEDGLKEARIECRVLTAFNERSAIAATHEMYNTPARDGDRTGSPREMKADIEYLCLVATVAVLALFVFGIMVGSL